MSPGALRQNLSLNLILAPLLFGGAGTLGWPEAWVFIALFNLGSQATGLWLKRHHPGLLAERRASPTDRNQKPAERIAMGLVFLIMAGWFAFMALDARRFGWSDAPVWLGAISGLLIAVAFFAWICVLRANGFASARIRQQPDEPRLSPRPDRTGSCGTRCVPTRSCFSSASHSCSARSGEFRARSSFWDCLRPERSVRKRCCSTACQATANMPSACGIGWCRACGEAAAHNAVSEKKSACSRSPVSLCCKSFSACDTVKGQNRAGREFDVPIVGIGQDILLLMTEFRHAQRITIGADLFTAGYTDRLVVIQRGLRRPCVFSRRGTRGQHHERQESELVHHHAFP